MSSSLKPQSVMFANRDQRLYFDYISNILAQLNLLLLVQDLLPVRDCKHRVRIVECDSQGVFVFKVGLSA